jgi:gamma-glutamyltranspeptidase/glutathione hydrolase
MTDYPLGKGVTDFSGDSIQVFKIGCASVAVPGTAKGLEEAHRRYGSLPWSELAAPAVELAREGVVVTQEQEYLHSILDPILRHTAESRAVYGAERPLAAGETLRMPDLASTLELIAARGADELYTGELAGAIVDHCAEGGGALTRRDLEEYRVLDREPVRASYRGHEYVSNPPPSIGGTLIAYALRLLDCVGGDPAPGSTGAIVRLAEAIREQGRVGGLDPVGLRANEDVAYTRMRAVVGTTHISVVDVQGNAAALTVSTGAGSGVVVPGTGIQLNNMIGEFDLPAPPPAGERMTSMMSPSIVFADGSPRLVVGSAGSLRLRSAVLQVVVNVVGHGLDVREAIERPRVHWEEPAHLHCEGGTDPAVVDELVERGYDVVRWRAKNLYFGGASAVEVAPDGTLRAAGDPRRGGHGIVVG